MILIQQTQIQQPIITYPYQYKLHYLHINHSFRPHLIIKFPLYFMQNRPCYDWDYEWLTPKKRVTTKVSSEKLKYFTPGNEKPGYQHVNVWVRNKEKRTSQQMSMHVKIINNDYVDTDSLPVNEQAIVFEKVVREKSTPQKRQSKTSADLINRSLWVDKYAPRKYVDLISDQMYNRVVLLWAKSWDKIVFKDKILKTENRKMIANMFKADKGDPIMKDVDETRLLLLSGPPGCGKTTLARIVAKHCGYNPVEINASDTRTARDLIRRIDSMASMQSISDKPTFIIVDQVDGIMDNETNGIGEILNYIHNGQIPGDKAGKKDKKKENERENQRKKPVKMDPTDEKVPLFTKRPIIFICNDPFVKGLKELRRKCKTIYMKKPFADRIADKLKSICDLEEIAVEKQAMMKIADLNDNDIRGSMAMLEFVTKHEDFKYVPTTKILNSIDWEPKDVCKGPIEFVERLMLIAYVKKDITFQSISDRLEEIDAEKAVVLLTLFHNLKYNKVVQRFPSRMPQLIDVICKADIVIKNSFGNEAAMEQIYAVPYYFFKQNYKAQDNMTRVEFPISFFQNLSKRREQIRRLQLLWNGMHSSLKIYYPPSCLNSNFLITLFGSIQTTRTSETDMLKKLKLMVMYGVKFEESGPDTYYPPLEAMIALGRREPMRLIITSTIKALMKNNYDNVKESIENLRIQEKMEWRATLPVTKSGMDEEFENIEYKWRDGTGTEVRDILKMNFFF